ncbi:MAG: macro domain-containing protein [candidate division Zixibacteria bacterium]|nr:macro domain-containing protein [candidate division Zixibacteria bacterium]
MADELTVNDRSLRLVKGDIIDLDIEAVVYYAQHDLNLGSGFGTAISIRGGPEVQKELKELGSLKTTEAVVTGAGEMKAKHIIHAVGPRFQEEGLENKLKATIDNALKQAEGKGIKAIVFPPMGTGFYGVPLDMCARVLLGSISDHLAGKTSLREVTVCLLDNREYKPFQAQIASMKK